LVPALLMHTAVPRGRPPAAASQVAVKIGGYAMCGLLALTIAFTVVGRQWLGLPPVWGMMAGLGLLKLLAFWLAKRDRACADAGTPYSIFRIMATAQWDTLLFFYGILLCVGSLATIGYLEWTSHALYGSGHLVLANTLMGVLSAIVDNIPIMYAVLRMNPEMDTGHWLLITLTTGVGGSLLSVGSRRRGRPHGAVARPVHFRQPFALVVGHRARLSRRHCCPSVGQSRFVHGAAVVGPALSTPRRLVFVEDRQQDQQVGDDAHEIYGTACIVCRLVQGHPASAECIQGERRGEKKKESILGTPVVPEKDQGHDRRAHRDRPQYELHHGRISRSHRAALPAA